MKPRITLAETTLPDGNTLQLQEHDQRLSLVIHGQQICGPSTRAAEEELARLACAPFRPARQPKIWFAGLGLGHSLAIACQELTQKKASFIVAEPLADLPNWHRSHLPEHPSVNDPRVSFTSSCSNSTLFKLDSSLHAILIHLDASPTGPDQKPLVFDRLWVSAAYQALQNGGLLAIAGSRHQTSITRKLHQAGFDVAEYTIPSSPNAKRPRMLPIWLARKGKYSDGN